MYTVQTTNGQEREAKGQQLTMSTTAGPCKKSAPAAPPPPKVEALVGTHMGILPCLAHTGWERLYSQPGPRLGHGHHGGPTNCHGPKKVLVPGLMLTSRGIGVPKHAKKGYRPGYGGRKMNFGF